MSVITGVRFVRSGRCRFVLILSALAVCLCVIFNSSQEQQKETKVKLMRCEEDKLALQQNERKQNEIYKQELKEQISLSKDLNATLIFEREEKNKIQAELLIIEKKLRVKNDSCKKDIEELRVKYAEALNKRERVTPQNNRMPLITERMSTKYGNNITHSQGKTFSAQISESPGVYKFVNNTATATAEAAGLNLKHNSVLSSERPQQFLNEPNLLLIKNQRQDKLKRNIDKSHSTSAAPLWNSSYDENLEQVMNSTYAYRAKNNKSSPPLAVPPKQSERKLPENVAPIPDNVQFEELPAASHKSTDRGENKNNRYSNDLNTVEIEPAIKRDNLKAHEFKQLNVNQNRDFNLLPEQDHNNFFEKADRNLLIEEDKINDIDMGGGGEINNEDDFVGNINGGGDLVNKKLHHLPDEGNLNNEIAGDQGKELPDFHVGEGNDEDGNDDDDDYSNMPARWQGGAQAIRN